VLKNLAEGTLAKLTALGSSTSDAAVKAALPAKLEAATQKLAKYAAPGDAYDKAVLRFHALLDEVDRTLAGATDEEPRFLLGAKPSLADVAVTALLARANWVSAPRELFLSRPAVARYWSFVSSRPQFAAADVWPTLKLTAGVLMIGDSAIDATSLLWHTVADPVAGAARVCGGAINVHVIQPAGGAINEHVIQPVATSPQFKAAHLAFDTTVMPKVREAASSTSAFVNSAAEAITAVHAGLSSGRPSLSPCTTSMPFTTET
jgi:hypothetical protein